MIIFKTNTEEKNFAQILYLYNYYNGNVDLIVKHLKSRYGKKTKIVGLRNKILKNIELINLEKPQEKINKQLESETK